MQTRLRLKQARALIRLASAPRRIHKGFEVGARLEIGISFALDAIDQSEDLMSKADFVVSAGKASDHRVIQKQSGIRSLY